MSKTIHQTPPTGSIGPIHADPGIRRSTATAGLAGPYADDEPAPEPTRRPMLVHSEPQSGLVRRGFKIELRNVEPDDMAERLRCMLGLAPEQPAPGEAAASYQRPLPPLVRSLDTGGWIAWCLAGLVIFGEGSPTLATIRCESKRVALALAIVRTRGCISDAARMLGSSRKVVRENLAAVGLQPWAARRIESRPEQGGEA
jgi:hypothetical protein